MNKVILLGNLTRDPELTQTNSGVSICRFSIAVSRRFANADGERGADFFNIVVWRNQAENCHKFLKKGSKCAVVGRLQTSTYETADGQKRYTTDIVAEEVEFINSARGGDTQDDVDAPKAQPQPKQTAELEEIEDDSLSF